MTRSLRWLWAGWLRALGPSDPGSAYVADEAAALPRSPAQGAQMDPQDVVAAAYDAFQREIYSFALRSTRDSEAAADVTQEAYLRLMREVGERGAPDNIRAWLYRVASNLVISGARRSTIADRWRHLVASPERTTATPEGSTLRRERDEQLQAALGQLQRDARTALLMAVNGFSGREIAASIGRSELATRSLLCRARMQLRDVLGPYEEAM